MILQLLIMLMLNTNSEIIEHEKYQYFPDHWPIHEELLKFDSKERGLLGSSFNLVGEKPLYNTKSDKAFRVYSWNGIISINIEKDDTCEIKYHRLNKDAIFNESLPKITSFSIGGIKNCSKEADLKTLKEFLWGVEISLPINFLKGIHLPDTICTVEAYRSGEEPIYQLKITGIEQDIKIIINYYKKISKLFKKHGININADFSPY